eukprot:7101906-Pyramimonas_sp.AAC.1
MAARITRNELQHGLRAQGKNGVLEVTGVTLRAIARAARRQDCRLAQQLMSAAEFGRRYLGIAEGGLA